MSKTILIVTRNLPPLIGGMERLNWHIADELSKSNKVLLLSHKEAKAIAPKNVSFYSAPLRPLPLFLVVAFLKTFWLCIRQKPDVLLAGSGLTAPIVVFFAKCFAKRSVVYIHGLDINNPSKIYSALWIPFIRWADKVVANSTPTKQLCLTHGVHAQKLSIIYPGVSFPAKARNEILIKSLQQRYALENKQILLSVGRLTERKGLNEFIEQSFSQIAKKHPHSVLLIVGDTPNQSLNKNVQSKSLLLATAKKYGIENQLIFTGNISDDELLASFYYLADIHVFPVRHLPHDPEGFGMVAVEAAAHGTPTVAFATGGIVDAVSSGESGFLLNNGDYAAFIQTVMQLLDNQLSPTSAQCQQFAQRFAWQAMGEQFQRLIN